MLLPKTLKCLWIKPPKPENIAPATEGFSALEASVFGVKILADFAAALGTIPKESIPAAFAQYAVPTTSKPVAREFDALPVVIRPEPAELEAVLDAPAISPLYSGDMLLSI